mmetsp:Transcript_15394/g.21264  ORF Transcript_15394/g.21264 Transcript_15394/m.21264 type:complete len:202 (+) Transcript_15394:339-944(+)
MVAFFTPWYTSLQTSIRRASRFRSESAATRASSARLRASSASCSTARAAAALRFRSTSTRHSLASCAIFIASSRSSRCFWTSSWARSSSACCWSRFRFSRAMVTALLVSVSARRWAALRSATSCSSCSFRSVARRTRSALSRCSLRNSHCKSWKRAFEATLTSLISTVSNQTPHPTSCFIICSRTVSRISSLFVMQSDRVC